MTESLQAEGGTLAYTVAGPSHGPLVLLAHGIADSRHAYRFIEPRLIKEGYRVINLDIRGCGDSSATFDAYSRTDMAGDIIAVLKKQGASQRSPAVIVGHSAAGGAATIAAANEPTLVSGLIELAPFTREQSMGLGDFMRTGPGRLISAVLFGSSSLWLWYLEAAMPGGKRPDDWQSEKERIRSKLAEPGRFAALKKMVFSPPTDAGAKLKDVKCPVLVIEGDADCDFASPRKEGELILGDLPQGLGQLEMIEGTGHYPHFQYPDETLARMLPFLAKVTKK